MSFHEFVSQDLETHTGERHTANSDRSLQTTRNPISVQGSLVSLNVRIVSGSPTVGRCHIRVVLESRAKAEKVTLARGYIYPGHEINGTGVLALEDGDSIRLESRCSLADVILEPIYTAVRGHYATGGWQGVDKGSLEGPGYIRVITGTDPAVNANIAEVVPTNARWKLKSMQATLVASSQVASRVLQFHVNDGSVNFLTLDAQTAQLADETRTYNLSMGVDLDEAGANWTMNFTKDLTLLAGYKLRMNALSLEDLDNWGAPLLSVEEWIEE